MSSFVLTVVINQYFRLLNFSQLKHQIISVVMLVSKTTKPEHCFLATDANDVCRLVHNFGPDLNT